MDASRVGGVQVLPRTNKGIFTMSKVMIDCFKSFGINRNTQASMSPDSLLGANGIFLAKEIEDNVFVVSNKGQTCRDNFFRSLYKELISKPAGNIDIYFSCPTGTRPESSIRSFQTMYKDAPHVKDIEFTPIKGPVYSEGIFNRVNEWGRNAGVTTKQVALGFSLIKASFPYPLFANPTISWVLTYDFRYRLSGTTTGDYSGFYNPYKKLLKTQYFDLILTDKESLIKEVWSNQIVRSFSGDIIQFNGPYGVYTWLPYVQTRTRDIDKLFVAVHKYLNTDLFMKSIKQP
jgi:hypothetical protein